MGEILYLFALLTLAAAGDWHYGDKGPSTWSEHYPICGHSAQSPINIKKNSAEYDAKLTPFHFHGYKHNPEGAAYTLENNGHAAQVNLEAHNHGAWSISGAALPATYIADQFHFHWGSVDSQGSEHTVNGKAYPMEMHIVHHDEQFDSISEAKLTPDGLAVLGFLFEIGDEDNPAFDELVEGLQNVPQHGDTDDLEPFPLASLLPADLDDYWRYSGSLTTPTCDESVIWTIFQKTIKISQDQLDAFRSLEFDSGDPLVNNFRPTQPLNGRKVYTSNFFDSAWSLLRILFKDLDF